MLGCGVKRKRVNGDVRLADADFKVLTSQQRGEFSVAVPQVQDDGDRVVFLRVRDQKVQQKAFAASGRAEGFEARVGGGGGRYALPDGIGASGTGACAEGAEGALACDAACTRLVRKPP